MTNSPFVGAEPSFAEMYERMLVGPLFSPWARLLIERAGVEPHHRVLDVACGTGIVARLVKQRLGAGGRVVGIDLSPVMIAVARAVAPELDWHEGNAAALPFGAGQFDVVFCQQGLQFMPDKEAAVREMRRVLAPGGKLGLATWRALDETPFFAALHRAAERHLGPVTDMRHGFGDAAALARLITGAGFGDVRIETMSLPIRLDDRAAFLRMNAMAMVGMAPGAKSLTDDERSAKAAPIAEDSAAAVRPFVDGDGVRFDLPANVATATAPS